MLSAADERKARGERNMSPPPCRHLRRVAFGRTPTTPPMMTRSKVREIREANHEPLRLLREVKGLERQYENTLSLLVEHKEGPKVDPEVVRILEHYERVDRWDLKEKREELVNYLENH